MLPRFGRIAAMMEALLAEPSAAVPPGAIDRRAHPRTPLRRGALLELGGRRFAVNLLDLSEGGVALQGWGVDAVPGTSVALILDTSLLPATVVEVEDGRLHLAFQPLSPAGLAVVRRLLALGTEPVLAA